VAEREAELSILALTSEIPWPLNTGGHLRTYHLLAQLAGRHRVRLIAPSAQPDPDAEAAIRAAGIALEAAPVAPRTPASSALAAIRAGASFEPYVLYRRHHAPAVKQALDVQMRSAPPDVLYLDHLDSFVYAPPPGPQVVVGDLHNVYSVLVARTADEETSAVVRRYLKHQAWLLARAERAAAQRADLLTAVSADDAAHYRSLGSTPVAIVSNGVDCAQYASLAVGRRSNAPLILFVGALSWGPNVAAVRFLATEVLPSVRARIPDARLRVIGRSPTDDVLRLGSEEGVDVVGCVSDVIPHLREAALLAVPLEAGGGTRLKILEAFAAGLPVVSTPVGCEGIAAEDGRHLVVASRDGFAEAIAGLLHAPDRGAALAAEARLLVQREYDWSSIGATASEAIRQAWAARRA
jgi:glycosyltransferase involved in cell wall biosynthesis